jgi:hypothetical protein
MNTVLHYIPQGSFYVHIMRIRYTGADYIKADLNYYYKGSLTLFAQEKSVKIYRKVLKNWHRIDIKDAISVPHPPIEEIEYATFFGRDGSFGDREQEAAVGVGEGTGQPP